MITKEAIIYEQASKFFQEYKLLNFGNDIEFAALECKRFIGFDFFNSSDVFFNYKLSPVNQPAAKTAEIVFLGDDFTISSKIILDFENWNFNKILV